MKLSEQDKKKMEESLKRLFTHDPHREWLAAQEPNKVKPMIYWYKMWQGADITDAKLCDKIGEILFRDKPFRKITITGRPPKPGSNI